MTDPIYILGIHDGHNCGASVSRDGMIVASVCEERLTRRKNEVGYPRHAIDDCLRIAGIEPKELDVVVYASLFMHAPRHLLDAQSWYQVGLNQQRADQTRSKEYAKHIFDLRKKERIDAVKEHLGTPEASIEFIEHHLAHLAAAYYTAPNATPGVPILGLTCDGAGDGISATVSVCRGNTIERISATDRHASLGKIYSRVTLLMGMTPWEHEYKLMGLAPYAEPARANKAAEIMRGLLRLSKDGLTFEQAGELSMNYCYEHLRGAFERVRFDTIAGAVQLFTEEMLTAWVRAAVQKTGIPDIVCGGGVFMNVKANMLIAQLPEVRSMYVMPSAGDESLSIGACLHRYYQSTGRTDFSDGVLHHLYLGGEFSRPDEEKAIGEKLRGRSLNVQQRNDVDDATADLLAEGEIVARCRSRMEWGARALGNRSLLASANDFRTVDRINRAIKKRDFWMPFAPSVRAESASRYFEDPKKLAPPFMTFTFPATAKGREDLAAGSHPRDGTMRAQIVTAAANPGYHGLITRFEDKTGRGGVLNTSFNLSGEPIVYSPSDALDVFLRSDLRHLALNHFLISKAQDA